MDPGKTEVFCVTFRILEGSHVEVGSRFVYILVFMEVYSMLERARGDLYSSHEFKNLMGVIIITKQVPKSQSHFFIYLHTVSRGDI